MEGFLTQHQRGHPMAKGDRFKAIDEIINTYMGINTLIVDLYGSLNMWFPILAKSSYPGLTILAKVPGGHASSNALQQKNLDFIQSNQPQINGLVNGIRPMDVKTCTCKNPFICVCVKSYLRNKRVLVLLEVDVSYHLKPSFVWALFKTYGNFANNLKIEFRSYAILQFVDIDGISVDEDSAQMVENGILTVLAKGDCVDWVSDVANVEPIFDGGYDTGSGFLVWVKKHQFSSTLVLQQVFSQNKGCSFKPVINKNEFEVLSVPCVLNSSDLTRTTVSEKTVIIPSTVAQQISARFANGTGVDPTLLFSRSKALVKSDPLLSASIGLMLYIKMINSYDMLLDTVFAKTDIKNMWKNWNLDTLFGKGGKLSVLIKHFKDSFFGGTGADTIFTKTSFWKDLGQLLGNLTRKSLVFILLCLLGLATLSTMGSVLVLVIPVGTALGLTIPAESFIRLLKSGYSSSYSDFIYDPLDLKGLTYHEISKMPLNLYFNNIQGFLPVITSDSLQIYRDYCHCGKQAKLCHLCDVRHCEECNSFCFVRGTFSNMAIPKSLKKAFYGGDLTVRPITSVVIEEFVRQLDFAPDDEDAFLFDNIIMTNVLKPKRLVRYSPLGVTAATILSSEQMYTDHNWKFMFLDKSQTHVVDNIKNGYCFTHLFGNTTAYSPIPLRSCGICNSNNVFAKESNPYAGLSKGSDYFCLAFGNIGYRNCDCQKVDDQEGQYIRIIFIKLMGNESKVKITPYKYTWWFCEVTCSVGDMFVTDLFGVSALVEVISVVHDREDLSNPFHYGTCFSDCSKLKIPVKYDMKFKAIISTSHVEPFFPAIDNKVICEIESQSKTIVQVKKPLLFNFQSDFFYKTIEIEKTRISKLNQGEVKTLKRVLEEPKLKLFEHKLHVEGSVNEKQSKSSKSINGNIITPKKQSKSSKSISGNVITPKSLSSCGEQISAPKITEKIELANVGEKPSMLCAKENKVYEEERKTAEINESICDYQQDIEYDSYEEDEVTSDTHGQEADDNVCSDVEPETQEILENDDLQSLPEGQQDDEIDDVQIEQQDDTPTMREDAVNDNSQLKQEDDALEKSKEEIAEEDKQRVIERKKFMELLHKCKIIDHGSKMEIDGKSLSGMCGWLSLTNDKMARILFSKLNILDYESKNGNMMTLDMMIDANLILKRQFAILTQYGPAVSLFSNLSTPHIYLISNNHWTTVEASNELLDYLLKNPTDTTAYVLNSTSLNNQSRSKIPKDILEEQVQVQQIAQNFEVQSMPKLTPSKKGAKFCTLVSIVDENGDYDGDICDQIQDSRGKSRVFCPGIKGTLDVTYTEFVRLRNETIIRNKQLERDDYFASYSKLPTILETSYNFENVCGDFEIDENTCVFVQDDKAKLLKTCPVDADKIVVIGKEGISYYNSVNMLFGIIIIGKEDPKLLSISRKTPNCFQYYAPTFLVNCVVNIKGFRSVRLLAPKFVTIPKNSMKTIKFENKPKYSMDQYIEVMTKSISERDKGDPNINPIDYCIGDDPYRVDPLNIDSVYTFHSMCLSNLSRCKDEKIDDMLQYLTTWYEVTMTCAETYSTIIEIILISGPGGIGKSKNFDGTLISFTKSSAGVNGSVTYQLALLGHILKCGVDEGLTAPLAYISFLMAKNKQEPVTVLSDTQQCIGGGKHAKHYSWFTREIIVSQFNNIYFPVTRGGTVVLVNPPDMVDDDIIYVHRQGGEMAQVVYDYFYNNNSNFKRICKARVVVSTAKKTLFQPLESTIQTHDPSAHFSICKKKANKFINPPNVHIGATKQTCREAQGFTTQERVHFEDTIKNQDDCLALVALTRSEYNVTMCKAAFNFLFDQRAAINCNVDYSDTNFLVPTDPKSTLNMNIVSDKTFTFNLAENKHNPKTKFTILSDYLIDMAHLEKKKLKVTDLTPDTGIMATYLRSKGVQVVEATRLRTPIKDQNGIVTYKSNKRPNSLYFEMYGCSKQCDRDSHSKKPTYACNIGKANPNLFEVVLIDAPTTLNYNQGNECLYWDHLVDFLLHLKGLGYVVQFKTTIQRIKLTDTYGLGIPTWMGTGYKNYEWYWMFNHKHTQSRTLYGGEVYQTVKVHSQKHEGLLYSGPCPKGREIIEVWVSQSVTRYVSCPNGYPSIMSFSHSEKVANGFKGFSLIMTIHSHDLNSSHMPSKEDTTIGDSIEFYRCQNFIVHNGQVYHKGVVVPHDFNGKQEVVKWTGSCSVYRFHPSRCIDEDDIYSGSSIQAKHTSLPIKLKPKVIKKAQLFPKPGVKVVETRSVTPWEEMQLKGIKLVDTVVKNLPGCLEKRRLCKVAPEELKLGSLPFFSFDINPTNTINAFVSRQVRFSSGSSEAVREFIANAFDNVWQEAQELGYAPKFSIVDHYSIQEFYEGLTSGRVKQLEAIKDEPFDTRDLHTYGGFAKNETILKDSTRLVSNAHVKLTKHICPMVKPILNQFKSLNDDFTIFTSGYTSDQVAKAMHHLNAAMDIDYTWFDSTLARTILNRIARRDLLSLYPGNLKWRAFILYYGCLLYKISLMYKEDKKKAKLKVISYTLYNSQPSGSPLTTILNTLYNMNLLLLACKLALGSFGLSCAKMGLGDDGLSELGFEHKGFVEKIASLIGMFPKVSDATFLAEYNSSYLVYGKDKQGNIVPRLVPKICRGLRRLYLEPRNVTLGEENIQNFQFTWEDLFILQSINYSEGNQLRSTPLVRVVMDRSIELFGSVKVDHNQYCRLVTERKYSTYWSEDYIEINDDYLDRYAQKELGISGQTLKTIENLYVTGVLTDLGSLIMDLQNPFKILTESTVNKEQREIENERINLYGHQINVFY